MKDEADEFIFAKPGGLPVNHNVFARHQISGFAKSVCPRYCRLYNGRHSTGSELKRLTEGNSLATADVLRNAVATAEASYIHTVTADGDAGLKLWERELAAAGARLKQTARAEIFGADSSLAPSQLGRSAWGAHTTTRIKSPEPSVERRRFPDGFLGRAPLAGQADCASSLHQLE